MLDLRDRPQGQTALELTRRLDPAAISLVEAILLGDLAATRSGGWAWGVWCAQQRLAQETPPRSIGPDEVAALAATVGPVTRTRPKKKRSADEEDVELAEFERSPIEAAARAVSMAESELGLLPEHREALIEAEWATAAGRSAALARWKKGRRR